MQPLKENLNFEKLRAEAPVKICLRLLLIFACCLIQLTHRYDH